MPCLTASAGKGSARCTSSHAPLHCRRTHTSEAGANKRAVLLLTRARSPFRCSAILQPGAIADLCPHAFQLGAAHLSTAPMPVLGCITWHLKMGAAKLRSIFPAVKLQEQAEKWPSRRAVDKALQKQRQAGGQGIGYSRRDCATKRGKKRCTCGSKMALLLGQGSG